MLKLLRVDDKLLHGQVAFSWVRNLKIHTIVIADDRIAYDEFSKMTLGLSKPSGVNLQILEMEKAIAFLKEHLLDDMHVMAIVNSIDKGAMIMKEIPQIDSLNLGVLREQYDSHAYSSNVSLTDEEIAICRDLIRASKEVEMRMHYEDKKVNLKEIISF